MHEATVQVRIPGCWVAQIANDGRSVRVVDRKVAAREMHSLFEVSRQGGGAPWSGLVEEIREVPAVTYAREVTSDEERLLGIVHCGNCHSCRTLLSSECFVMDTVARDGTIEWTLRFDERAKLAQLLEDLKRMRIPTEVKRVVPVRGGSILTPRQEEVLRLAVEMGYFEFPKRVGVAGLAKRFGVSKSTLSETLHRAERKILQSYLRHR